MRLTRLKPRPRKTERRHNSPQTSGLLEPCASGQTPIPGGTGICLSPVVWRSVSSGFTAIPFPCSWDEGVDTHRPVRTIPSRQSGNTVSGPVDGLDWRAFSDVIPGVHPGLIQFPNRFRTRRTGSCHGAMGAGRGGTFRKNTGWMTNNHKIARSVLPQSGIDLASS